MARKAKAKTRVKAKKRAPRPAPELTSEEFESKLAAAGALTYEPTPEEWKRFTEREEEMKKIRGSMDRALAIRDNQIAPPWLKPLLKQFSKPESQESLPVHARRGPNAKDDWPTHLAQWLLSVTYDDREKIRNISQLVRDFRDFAQEQKWWVPKDDKQVRAKIVELLKLAPRR